MSVNWDLAAPSALITAVAVGQILNTIRERRTGEVVWWAKHINVFGLVFLPINYSDPARMRTRRWENVFMSAAWTIIAIVVGWKFVGL